MSYRSIVATAVLTLSLVGCNHSSPSAPADAPVDPGTPSAANFDGYFMEGGAMIMVKEGKEARMEKEVTMSNGVKVAIDGMVTLADGTAIRLPEGMMITTDGSLRLRAEKVAVPSSQTSVPSVKAPSSGAAVASAQATYGALTDAVLTNGKTKVLFFSASWCPECKESDALLKTLLPSSDYSRSVYKVDYDTAKELKAKYGVVYQHTFVVVDGQGGKVLLVQGPTEQQLKEMLQ